MLILWKFRSVADHDKAAKGLRQRCGQRPEEGRVQVITHKGQVIIIYAGLAAASSVCLSMQEKFLILKPLNLYWNKQTLRLRNLLICSENHRGLSTTMAAVHMRNVPERSATLSSPEACAWQLTAKPRLDLAASARRQTLNIHNIFHHQPKVTKASC